MALSCSSLCGHLSLIRLYGLRTNRAANILYSQHVLYPSRLSPYRHYSSSQDRRGIGQYVSSRVQMATVKCISFLKRRYPHLYKLQMILVEGVQLLIKDGKDVTNIKLKMASEGLDFKDLPYRDLDKFRQFRRVVLKAIPLVLIALPPFFNYLVLVLMYYFPRQFLIPYFWTPEQKVEFQGVYHSDRAKHYWPVLKGLENTSHQIKDDQLRTRLKNICAKVQRGAKPNPPEILAIRSLFSGPPLGIKKMSVDQMKHFCPILFLTPRLPGFLIGRRLNQYGLELLYLDRALCRLGPTNLSDAEIREACYVRGLNPNIVGINQCREWLFQWLTVTSSLKDSEVSLLLHSMAIFSVNYPHGPSKH